MKSSRRSGRRVVSRGCEPAVEWIFFSPCKHFRQPRTQFSRADVIGGVRLFFTFSLLSRHARPTTTPYICLSRVTFRCCLSDFVRRKQRNRLVALTRCFRIGSCRRLRFTACLQSRATLFEESHRLTLSLHTDLKNGNSREQTTQSCWLIRRSRFTFSSPPIYDFEEQVATLAAAGI